MGAIAIKGWYWDVLEYFLQNTFPSNIENSNIVKFKYNF